MVDPRLLLLLIKQGLVVDLKRERRKRKKFKHFLIVVVVDSSNGIKGRLP